MRSSVVCRLCSIGREGQPPFSPAGVGASRIPKSTYLEPNGLIHRSWRKVATVTVLVKKLSGEPSTCVGGGIAMFLPHFRNSGPTSFSPVPPEPGAMSPLGAGGVGNRSRNLITADPEGSQRERTVAAHPNPRAAVSVPGHRHPGPQAARVPARRRSGAVDADLRRTGPRGPRGRRRAAPVRAAGCAGAAALPGRPGLRGRVHRLPVRRGDRGAHGTRGGWAERSRGTGQVGGARRRPGGPAVHRGVPARQHVLAGRRGRHTDPADRHRPDRPGRRARTGRRHRSTRTRWPTCSTRPGRPAGRRGWCSPTGRCCTTSR